MKDKEEHTEKLAEPPKEEMLVHQELKLLTEKQEQRIADLENLVKRLNADFDNFRKQKEKEKSEMQSASNASIIRKLLPMLDEFEHSLQKAKEQKTSKEVLDGFAMTYNNMLKSLQGQGLKEMQVSHESFDPYKHEALRYEESEFEDGKIASVVRKGYYFHDHVLRVAGVIVSKGKSKKQETEKGEING